MYIYILARVTGVARGIFKNRILKKKKNKNLEKMIICEFITPGPGYSWVP